MNESPFKFLDSYTKADKDIFFGREKETEEIFSRLFYSKMLLIYGPSGSGKTSLLQCGVANRFGEHDWKPIFIRRKQNIIHSINSELGKQAITSLKEKSTVKENLYSLYLDYLTPIYLIFDQFEELFIFGTIDEKQEFVNEIKNILSSSDGNTHIIFSIREEYLANLTAFEDDIPELFENRIRIEKMKKPQAIAAIEEPCKVGEVSLEEGVSEKVLERLSTKSGFIELTWLQVIMDSLYKKAFERDTSQLIIKNEDVDQLGKMGDVLGNFLNEQLKAMEEGEKGEAILKAMISSDGTKRQLTIEELNSSLQSLGKQFSKENILNLLQHLVNVRIISDKDENGRYELKHDSLAAKIYEKLTLAEKELLEVRQFIENAYQHYLNRKVLLRQEDLNYISPYQSKLILKNELLNFIKASKKEIEKTRKRKRRVIAIAGLMAITILIGFSYWTWKQSRISRSNELAAFALTKLETDPTLAYLLSEKAYRTYEGFLSKKVLFESFNKKNFYRTLPGSDFQISPTDNYLITTTSDTTIALWNINFNLIKDEIPHNKYSNNGYIIRPIIINDGKLFITSKDFVIYTWSSEGQLIDKFIFDRKEFNLDDEKLQFKYYIFDDRYVVLYIYSESNLCYVLDIKTREKIRIAAGDSTNENIWQVKISFDRKHFLIATQSDLSPENDNLYLYNRNGNLLNITQIKAYSTPHFINDSSYFLDGRDTSFKIYNLKGKIIKQLNLGNGFCYLMDYSKDSIMIVLKDNTAYIVNQSDYTTHNLGICSLSGGNFSETSKYIAIYNYRTDISIIYNTDGSKVSELDGPFISFSSDDKYSITKKANTINVNTIDGNLISSLIVPKSNNLDAILFKSNEHIILSNGYSNHCYLWKFLEKDPLVFNNKALLGMNKPLTCRSSEKYYTSDFLKISSSGELLLSSIGSDTLYLFNNYGNLVNKFIEGEGKEFYNGFFLNNDKNILTLNIHNESILWHTNGDKIFSFDYFGKIENSTNTFQYLPKIDLIISNSKNDNTTIYVYKLDGDVVNKLYGHNSPVVSIKADNNNLYSLSENGKIYIWNLSNISESNCLIDSIIFNRTKPIYINFSKDKNKFLVCFSDSSFYVGDIRKVNNRDLSHKFTDYYNKIEFINDDLYLCHFIESRTAIISGNGKRFKQFVVMAYNGKLIKSNGEELKPIKNTNVIYSLNIDQTCDQLICSYKNKQNECKTSILDNNLNILYTIPTSTIAFSPNDDFIAAIEEGKIKLYPANVEKIVKLIREDKIYGEIRDFTEEEKKEFRIKN